MGKKLNRTEIVALTKKILIDVNETNTKYNDSIINSQTYKDEVLRIESQDPLKEIKDRFIKELKIKFGTDWEKEVRFILDTYTRYESTANKEKEINKELSDYKKKVLKPIYKTENVSTYENGVYINHFENIVQDIIIAQIDISDVQTLINTIKSKLV